MIKATSVILVLILLLLGMARVLNFLTPDQFIDVTGKAFAVIALILLSAIILKVVLAKKPSATQQNSETNNNPGPKF